MQKLSGKIAMFFLGAWLLLSGLNALLNINIPAIDMLLPIVAIVTAILIFTEIREKPTQQLGMLLLAVWLILSGLFVLLSVAFPAKEVVMAVLGIAAGVLVLIRR